MHWNRRWAGKRALRDWPGFVETKPIFLAATSPLSPTTSELLDQTHQTTPNLSGKSFASPSESIVSIPSSHPLSPVPLSRAPADLTSSQARLLVHGDIQDRRHPDSQHHHSSPHLVSSIHIPVPCDRVYALYSHLYPSPWPPGQTLCRGQPSGDVGAAHESTLYATALPDSTNAISRHLARSHCIFRINMLTDTQSCHF